MNKKTIKFNVPSLHLTQDFLASLGKILESQVKNKDKSKTWREYITYSIQSSNEELSFISMNDLLQTDLFPKNISSMTLRITPYDDSYVNIIIEFDNNFVTESKVRLNSTNDERLLKVEHDLKELFSRYETGYSWVYKIFGYYYGYLAVLLLVIFGFLVEGAILMFIHQYIFKINKDNILLLFFGLSIPFQVLSVIFLEKLLPKYRFNIDKHKILRFTLIGIIGLLFSNLIFGIFLYFVKNLLKLPK